MNKTIVLLLCLATMAFQSAAYGSDSDGGTRTALLRALEIQLSVAEKLGRDDLVPLLVKSIDELEHASDDQIPIEIEDAAYEFWNTVDAMQQFEQQLDLLPEDAVLEKSAKETSSLEKQTPGITVQSTISPAINLSGPDYFNGVCGANIANGIRSDTGALIAGKIALSVARVAWAATEVACGLDTLAILSGGTASIVCIAAAALVGTAEEIVAGFEMCDATVDEAHLDAAFFRAKDNFDLNTHIHGDLQTHDGRLSTHDAALTAAVNSLSTHNGNLATHDTNLTTRADTIDANLDAHDTNLITRTSTIGANLSIHNSNLSTHDGNLTTRADTIDSDLADHDSNLTTRANTIDSDLAAHDGNLATHDTDIKALLQGAQATLDEKVELRKVFMQVVQVVQRQRYLVSTSEAGVGVDVTFETIEVFNEKTGLFEDLSTATTDQVAMGVYDLQLNLPDGGPKEDIPDKIFLLEVQHDDNVDHFGRIIFNRTSVQASN